MKVKGGGIIGRGIGAIGAGTKEDKAIVALNYRLIDAETSEIIATGEARGESSRKSKGFAAVAGALGKGVAGAEIDMTSSGFAENDHRRGDHGLRQQTGCDPRRTDQQHEAERARSGNGCRRR
jgi:hypothetical protein